MSDDRGKAENSTGSSDTDDAAASAASSRPTGKRPGRRSSAAADSSAATTVAATGPSAPAKKAEKPRKENLFKRFRRFMREVIAELRKVIWPNRKQMVTYTTVVLVFVAFMVAFIFGLDLAFVKGVTWLFG
ncbi:Protein translocase subunit SecE [Rhodococcus sp. RD6.2]|uniref:preprotein translocase subunit SecE n=1 Tax=Rhodococcus sp. RD6.2 TaxID=260936 RepID=UPI00063B68FD|nr:preprotein translocase subunit SecE [Rhodococcus sp. RD6.2]CRK52648.1 Protein translocase subunit SecE [Rhodococcus sp. RD6.2]